MSKKLFFITLHLKRNSKTITNNIFFITMEKRLMKSADKKFCGVCGGIANYFDIDPTIIHAIYAALTLFSAAFPGIILYFVLAVVMPSEH